MEQFYFTKIGQKYAAKTATGSIMEFTIGKFGDGIPVAEPMDLTDLVSPLGELFIFKKTSEGNQVVVQTQFTNVINGEILPAFHLKEIGLFAKLRTADGKEDKDNPETLVAYAHVMGDDYGDYIPNTPTEFIINWPFQISNSQNVSVNVGLMSYALQKDFEELKETVESKPHVAVVYRNEPTPEPNTLYVILDEDKPGAEAINTVVYDNVVFDEDEPETPAENWFQTEGGETNVNSESEDTEGTKIIMQNGKLTVLKEPEADTTFLSD